jgi:FixJ family two-component response regulator
MRGFQRLAAAAKHHLRFDFSRRHVQRIGADRPLISVVDDDHSMREAVSSLIQSVGMRVESFGSTEEFVQCDHMGEIACLILDVKMPGMSGLELQRHLASAQQRIPIIFVTGHGDDIMRKQALNAGAVEFLYKPFSDESLLSAVNSALNRQSEANHGAGD